MGGAMKYLPKRLLGHEIFRSMVSRATNFFFEKFVKPSRPPSLPPTYLTGAQRGYLKCSNRGINNQLPNIFYKFIHLPLFNVEHKIVHLQVVTRQIFVFRKPCLLQTEENECLWSYGRASLVLDFKLTQENDDLLSSRQK